MKTNRSEPTEKNCAINSALLSCTLTVAVLIKCAPPTYVLLSKLCYLIWYIVLVTHHQGREIPLAGISVSVSSLSRILKYHILLAINSRWKYRNQQYWNHSFELCMFNDMVKWNMCIENNTFKFTHPHIYSVFLIFWESCPVF